MVAAMSHLENTLQTDMNSAEIVWQRIKQHLEAEKLRIFQEIRQYLPPIPACDVQFNSLLAERVAVLQELGHVEEILKQQLTGEDALSRLNEFIQAAHYVDDELKASISPSHSLL